jgi:hypothetical protein
MATQNLGTTVAGTTTLSDFKSWAKAISDWMAAIGWTQTNDTGQAVWTATVLTCTQVAMSGTTATISYSSFTGPAPRAGMSVTFSGFSNGGNNTALTLTAVSGGSSGTVTATNASGVNETHSGSGTTTALAAVPANPAVVYEIWQSADAISSTNPIFVKFEYGAGTVSNTHFFAFTAACGSNGSGTLTTNIGTRYATTSNVATTSACSSIFSGDTSRFCIAMFINAGSPSNGFFVGVERSHDSSGADTNTYFMTATIQNASGTHTYGQQIIQRPSVGGALSAEIVMVTAITSLTSGVVGSSIAIGPLFPVYGKLDNPSMMCAFSRGGDIIEGANVTVPYFGSNHTMYCTKATTVYTTVPGTTGASGNGFLMRYE